MSPDRKFAFDNLRRMQRDLRSWRWASVYYASHGSDYGPDLRAAQERVKEALDRYWGVVSREELLAAHPGSLANWDNHFRNRMA